jgi:hypothetical protein
MEGNPINIKASGLSSPSQKIVVFSSRLMPDGRFEDYHLANHSVGSVLDMTQVFARAVWPVPEIGAPGLSLRRPRHSRPHYKLSFPY